MSPIIERLSNQLNPIFNRLDDRRQALRRKGNEMLAGLHERQEKLFDRGQRAINGFEETVLERVGELLAWAQQMTGERSDALRKTSDFVNERLAELREAAEELDGELAADTFEDVDEPVEVADEVDDEPVAAAHDEADSAPTPPFDNYDDLNVKKLALRFNDLDEAGLTQARAYEEANKQRKTVFDTIDRLLS